MKEKALSALLYLIALLPFWFLYKVADLIYLILYYVVKYRRKVVAENLRNSFPEKSASERQEIEKKFFKFLPDLFVEALKMKSISPEEVKDRIQLIDEDEILRHVRAHKGVVAVTAHYGNWELAIHRFGFMLEEPKLVIYKPLNNPVMESVYNAIRTRFGAIMVPMKQILRHIVKLRGQGFISVFVADQTPLHQDSDYFINFLNQETLVYTGPERIARMQNSPIVYCHIAPAEKRGYYTCKFTTLVEDPSQYKEHEITNLHNKFTEDRIREEPAYWLWSHRRWKRKRRK
ncbi:lysophospholipid acyltransferase family protein [Sphingobacteriaceae bacterium WQ 2009]|uniref:Lysophospholipid acyltransferase family protein n=1 Tax=Rhinopithecimicrobium faecis TaxID=2820698 RepID=A0A8T4HCY6_9SPHI|nr:lysophospholipid acyltransferase family protein [Sphingobacteriaceae bacterium WQ 2009]